MPISTQHYILGALEQGLRIDLSGPTRKLDEIRVPKITLGLEAGFVEVAWGNTQLAVRVSANISKPFEDRPFEGQFQINCEILLMALAQFDNQLNRLAMETVTLRLIEKAIKRLNALDLELLCIIAGEKVWHVVVDINYLNYDGNLVDPGCFAVMMALQQFKKPDVTIRGVEVEVHPDRAVPLSILHTPICVSYAFFNRHPDMVANIKGDANDEMWVVDPSRDEELMADGHLVVTLNKNRELIQLLKNGGLPIDAAQLVELCLASNKYVDALTDLMNGELEKWEAAHYNPLLEGMALREEHAVRVEEEQTEPTVGSKTLPME